ncbi:unnamed protein product [Peronospora farinosa]|uniref:WRKY19-like zinc finger domain-containing protein n=1 Tax=Peronospora farinosa TaxID=134698 RepID=A0ABN8CH92_9STRA|nr:unnamed protein product [Peronospora farinosa]
MPSLDHLLCASTIEKKSRSNLDSMCCSNQHNALPTDPGTKPNSRRCNAPNCRKTAKRGGRCIAHGGGNKCAIDGCTTSVVSRGLCVAHGGGKRCQAPTCAKSAQSGGFCWVHGGGKKCGYHGCPKRAQSGGACIAHGGGKRCRIGGCNKVVQYDGLCVGHGGYRRCVYTNCDGRAMANDYCQRHGGSSVCLLGRCYKRAVRGGMCTEHKAEASVQAVTTGRLSTPSQTLDDDQDHQIDRSANQYPLTTEWRRRTNSTDLTNNKCSPGSGITPIYEKVSSPSSPLAKFAHEDEKDTNQREDSPLVPGFSALLSADGNFASFPRIRYPHQEQSVYPLLPSIRSLQTHRAGIAVLKNSLTSHTTPNLRIVVNHDNASLKWEPTTGSEPQERTDSCTNSDELAAHKLFVHSYYYRTNNGSFSCSTTPPHRHNWGTHHVR